MSDKVVWILGAGFSKPLGGPLLNDFFSPRFVAIAQGLLPPQSRPAQRLEAVAIAYRLLREDGLVDDPEDFLNIVDTAQHEAHSQSQQCRSLLRRLRGRNGRIFENGVVPSFGDGVDAVKEYGSLSSAANRVQLRIFCTSPSARPGRLSRAVGSLSTMGRQPPRAPGYSHHLQL